MKLHLLGASCLLALLSACSSGEEEQTKIPEIPSAKQIPITLNCVASTTSANGIATATGTAKTILPLENGNNRSYKALIVPQTASGSNFITVNIDGRDFNLKKEFTFVGGKRHTFSVTVSKTSNGINVGIGAWEDDDIDNGGVAE